MASFLYINKNKETLDFVNDKDFIVTNIDAQTQATTSISSTVTGGIDGDQVNNTQAQPRTIVIDLKIIGNVELTKRKILDTIKLKQDCTIRWEQENRTLEIAGKIEEIDMPRWTDDVVMQITIHCGQPFWEDIEQVVEEVSEVIALHFFTEYDNDQLIFITEGIPFGRYDLTRRREINNRGDVAVGLDIEVIAIEDVTNPIIYNQDNKFFGVGYGTGSKKVVMTAGDIIRIKTGVNEKSVFLNSTNMLGKIKPNSTWLQLEAGLNEFAINSDEESTENMYFNLSYKQRFI